MCVATALRKNRGSVAPGGRPGRVVVVGDLNGAADALWVLLRGTRLVDAHGSWIGGRAQLVQMGDVFNRGGGARRALEWLFVLKRQARRAGGSVTVLLGNHEVMTALRNEAYCTEEEYLSFATARERAAWPERVRVAARRILRDHPTRGPIAPIGPRLDVWRIANVPGRVAMRRALGPEARLGRALRSLPVAHVAANTVFVHAGLLPAFARRGVDALNHDAREAWTAARFYRRLPRSSLFRNPAGPLWNRSLVMGSEDQALARSLELLGVDRMVVGHTATSHVAGGTAGHVGLRYRSRLVCVDVGLREGDPWASAALVIEGGTGWEWTPEGTRQLWRDPPR